MKYMNKPIFYTFTVFLLSTLLVTVWFLIAFHSPSLTINLVSVKNIVIRYGFVLSIPPAVSFLIIYLMYQKIKTRWVFYLLTVIILGCLFFFMAYLFIWYVGTSFLIDSPFVE